MSAPRREIADVIALYRRFAGMVPGCGPVTIVREKTRIAFQVRMSFAAAMLKQRWLDGHVVLARRLEDPRFRVIQTISPRNHVHQFRIQTRIWSAGDCAKPTPSESSGI